MKLQDPRLFKEQCFVDGSWVGADGGGTLPVHNPATAAALPPWAARTAKDRAGLMRRWFDLMLANQDDLAILMTAEQGKPLAESKGEIAYAASFIEWFAEEGKRLY